MEVDLNQPISHLIRAARRERKLSQYTLARELATVSGRPTVTRDLVARWERGHQIPRLGTRRWLSVVLQVPQERLDQAAAAARRRNRLGHAVVTENAPATPGPARRAQGTPALLPVFRSRVQAGILAATLLNPDRSFSLTELAEHSGSSLASVDKENKLLEKAGILTSRRDGTIRLMRASGDGPLARPLAELLRLTYGVPQIIGEEFGCVRNVLRILVGGVWADRFAGLPGPAPESIELLVSVQPGVPVDEQALHTAARRAEQRLKRPVSFSIAAAERGVDGLQIPRQRPGHPIVEIAPIRPRQAPLTSGIGLTGHDVVIQLVRAGHLDLVGGPAANGQPFLDLAAEHISSVERLAEVSPDSAFLLLAKAAQLIGAGLLARQGLRPALSAPDQVVGTAVTAQFGHQFSQIELLRQRAKELDMPTSRDSHILPSEAKTYLSTVRTLLAAAREVSDKLALFH